MTGCPRSPPAPRQRDAGACAPDQGAPGRPVMKAIKVATAADAEAAFAFQGICDLILFDAKAPQDLRVRCPAATASPSTGTCSTASRARSPTCSPAGSPPTTSPRPSASPARRPSTSPPASRCGPARRTGTDRRFLAAAGRRDTTPRSPGESIPWPADPARLRVRSRKPPGCARAPRRALNSFRTGPDERGFFGMFGGRFVAETLMPLILELEKAYERPRPIPTFQAELDASQHALCRPAEPALFRRAADRSTSAAPRSTSSATSSITPAATRSTTASARSCSRGAWARRASSPRPAPASTASRSRPCARKFDLPCEIYMGATDIERQTPNVVAHEAARRQGQRRSPPAPAR